MAQFSPTTKRPKAGANAAGGRRADFSWIGNLVGATGSGAESNAEMTPAATNYTGGGYTGDTPVFTDSSGVTSGGDVNTPVNLTPAQTQLYHQQFNPAKDNLYESPGYWKRLTNPGASKAIDQANFNARTAFATNQMGDNVANAKALSDLRGLAAQAGFDNPDEQEFAAQLALKQLGSQNVNTQGAGNASAEYQQRLATLANTQAGNAGVKAESGIRQLDLGKRQAVDPSAIQLDIAKNGSAIRQLPSAEKAAISGNELTGAQNYRGKVMQAPQTTLDLARIQSQIAQQPLEAAARNASLANVKFGSPEEKYNLTLNPSGDASIAQNPNYFNRSDFLGQLGGAGSTNLQGGMIDSTTGRVLIPAPKMLAAPAATNQLAPSATSIQSQPGVSNSQVTNGAESDEDFYRRYMAQQRGGIPANMVIPNY